MSEPIIIDAFNKIEIKREIVFHMMDCSTDSPVYEDVCEAYELLKPWLYEHVRPRAVITDHTITAEEACESISVGDQLLFSVATLGDGPEKESTARFACGEYLEGMLLDAMADNYLFQMEAQLMDTLRAYSAQLNLGIVKRLEAPQDLPMTYQKFAYEATRVETLWGMGMTSGYMFDPVKTSCGVFVLTRDASIFHAQHQCDSCPNVNCKLRNLRQ